MDVSPAGSLLAYLGQIPDPRGRQGLRHPMTAMMAAIVCAVLSGARGYAAIAQWVWAQPAAVWHVLGFHRTPPTRNAYRNLLLRLRSEEFEGAVREWVGACLGTAVSDEMLSAVAMDGKALCGTLSAHRRTLPRTTPSPPQSHQPPRHQTQDVEVAQKTRHHFHPPPLPKTFLQSVVMVNTTAHFVRKSFYGMTGPRRPGVRHGEVRDDRRSDREFGA